MPTYNKLTKCAIIGFSSRFFHLFCHLVQSDNETRGADDATPDEVTCDEMTPEEVTPESVTPEKVTPERVTPEEVTPEKVMPERVTPQKVTSEKVTPEKATLAAEHVLHSQISSSKLELAMEIGKFIDNLEEQLELLPTKDICYVRGMSFRFIFK